MRFRIEERLGEGAVGETHRAVDRASGEWVALKLLRAGVPIEPLRAEFLVLRELSHPCLARVRDFGVTTIGADRRVFLTSDYVHGRALDTFAGQTFESGLPAVVDVLEALSFLHTRNVVHGDVKAPNVVVGDDHAVLLDLGCARAPGRYAELHGTLDHLAPEVRHGNVSFAADVFALGVTLEALQLRDAPTATLARMRAPAPGDRPSVDELLELWSAGRPRQVAPGRRRSDRIGLEEALAAVSACVRRVQLDEEGPRSLLLRGPAGAGRTRALIEAKWVAQEHVDTYEGRAEPNGAVRAMVARALDEPAVVGRTNLVAQIDRLVDRPLVLCLDDADALSPSDAADLELLVRALGRRGRALLLVAGDLELEGEQHPLRPWTADQIETYLGDHVPREGLERLLHHSGGLPARVQQLAGDLPAAALTAEAVERQARVRAHGRQTEKELDPESACLLARQLEAAGRPARALAVVARALRRRPPEPWPARLRRIGATCALRRGEARKAVARLRALDASDVASDLALALLRVGNHREAAEVIAAALPGADPATASELLCTRLFLDGYLGEDPSPTLQALATRELTPRTRFRFESGRAFLAHRRADSLRAAQHYQAALSIAEASSLDDLLVPAALNAGTAAHQAGDLGAALRCYERGLRLATAFGAVSTSVTLDFNLGRLHLDVGAFERARTAARRALTGAVREGMRFIEGASHALLAEIGASTGERALALRQLDEADEILGREGAVRELLETALQRAELDGSVDLEALVERARAGSFPDLEARALKVAASRRKPAEAIGALETAVQLAQRTGQVLLAAEIEADLSDAWSACGATHLAERTRSTARAGFERAAAGLPAPLLAAFREHPRRRGLFRERTTVSGEAERLRHLVAINRRLGSATTTTAVLEAALDAAIELSRAERGFLLLREGRQHRVAVARNVDRERLGRSSLKFSRAVAQRVVELGEPLLATDAEEDARFSASRSVHALRLKSILCVPIRSEDGSVTGALYLDHRFRPAAFSTDDLEIVAAFADQAALALSRAQLVDALRKKNEELAVERASLARVAEERAVRIEQLEQRLSPDEPRHPYAEIVGRGPAMTRLLTRIDRVVDNDVTVLITGESGTGKELVARAIHHHGPRRRAPFLALNCGAVPEALLESELFGVRKGAFTGAVRDQPGLFLAASGGTVLLDELGEMPLAMQVKLLRVLQEGEVRALGSEHAVRVDVRVLCATHRDLQAAVAAGRFREDLYYRISVMTLTTPPLRERLEDIPLLAAAVLERVARSVRRPCPTLDRSAERALLRHGWPGNVRELENVLTKAVLFCDSGTLHAEDLSLDHEDEHPQPRVRGGNATEAARFRAALQATGWNVSAAARVLAVPRATFYRKLARYRLERQP